MIATDLTEELCQLAEARHRDWSARELRPEWGRRVAELDSQRVSSSGKALLALRVTQELLTREVRERISIYETVARDRECWEMLSKPRLDELRGRIMISVGSSISSLRNRTKRATRAVGYSQSALPNEKRYEDVQAGVLTVVNTALARLEAEGRVAIGFQERPPAVLHQGFAEGAMEKSAADAATATRLKPPLEAVAEDEERREKAKGDLVRALQSYINKLDNTRARDVNRETAIFCDYACENYASRAAVGLLRPQSTEPEVLFGVADLNQRGDLNGSETFGDVLDLVTRLKLKRPAHWPDSGAIRPSDSAKMRKAVRGMFGGLEVSFDCLLEEPWDNWFRPQMRKCIKECVDAARRRYKERLSSRLQNHPDLKATDGEARRPDAIKAADRQRFLAPHIAPTPRKPSMNALAEKIDIGQSSLSRWHNGKTKLSETNVGKLAEHLKVESTTIPN
jgi:hypothetical protein